MPFWLRTAWAALKGFIKAFAEEYLRRQTDANAGAERQRTADDEADELKADEAGRKADEIGDLSDAELRERARRKWMQPD